MEVAAKSTCGQIVQKLKEQKGGMSIMAVTLLLFCAAVIIAVMAYMATMINFQKIDDDIQSATLATITANSHNIFAGVREGNSAERIKISSDWEKSIDISTSAVASELARTYSCSASGNSITQNNFSVSIIDIDVVDVDIQNNLGRCKIYTTAKVTIPFKLLNLVVPITRTEKVASEFSSYF